LATGWGGRDVAALSAATHDAIRSCGPRLFVQGPEGQCKLSQVGRLAERILTGDVDAAAESFGCPDALERAPPLKMNSALAGALSELLRGAGSPRECIRRLLDVDGGAPPMLAEIIVAALDPAVAMDATKRLE
jgi:hypothetical protein